MSHVCTKESHDCLNAQQIAMTQGSPSCRTARLHQDFYSAYLGSIINLLKLSSFLCKNTSTVVAPQIYESENNSVRGLVPMKIGVKKCINILFQTFLAARPVLIFPHRRKQSAEYTRVLIPVRLERKRNNESLDACSKCDAPTATWPTVRKIA
jgi:hypothetical protein